MLPGMCLKHYERPNLSKHISGEPGMLSVPLPVPPKHPRFNSRGHQCQERPLTPGDFGLFALSGAFGCAITHSVAGMGGWERGAAEAPKPTCWDFLVVFLLS